MQDDEGVGRERVEGWADEEEGEEEEGGGLAGLRRALGVALEEGGEVARRLARSRKDAERFEVEKEAGERGFEVETEARRAEMEERRRDLESLGRSTPTHTRHIQHMISLLHIQHFFASRFRKRQC